MAFDYLAETNALISALKVEGLPGEASKLQEAMDGAATGSELLFRVRFVLNSIVDSDISQTAKARVKKLLDGINDLLR
jgi:hypothetical protein